MATRQLPTLCIVASCMSLWHGCVLHVGMLICLLRQVSMMLCMAGSGRLAVSFGAFRDECRLEVVVLVLPAGAVLRECLPAPALAGRPSSSL